MDYLFSLVCIKHRKIFLLLAYISHVQTISNEALLTYYLLMLLVKALESPHFREVSLKLNLILLNHLKEIRWPLYKNVMLNYPPRGRYDYHSLKWPMIMKRKGVEGLQPTKFILKRHSKMPTFIHNEATKKCKVMVYSWSLKDFGARWHTRMERVKTQLGYGSGLGTPSKIS